MNTKDAILKLDIHKAHVITADKIIKIRKNILKISFAIDQAINWYWARSPR